MVRYYISFVNNGIRYYFSYNGNEYFLVPKRADAITYFTEETAISVIKEQIIPILPSLIRDYKVGYFELIIETTIEYMKLDHDGNPIPKKKPKFFSKSY